MTLREKWEKLLEQSTNIYIFGTGEVAKRLLELIRQFDSQNKIKGFIVSTLDKDSSSFMGFPVTVYTDNLDSAMNTVLVSVSKEYHPEVYDIFQDAKNMIIIDALEYYNLELFREEAISQIDEMIIDKKKEDDLEPRLKEIRNLLVKEYSKYSFSFGNEYFYQSYPPLNLYGQRPTDIRLKTYGLEEYLDKSKSVLDIGCNCGFLDLYISDNVAKIIGIEYSENLCRIGQMAVKELQKKNIEIINSDYNIWQKKNKNKFDIILSFAVHIWLGISPSTYAKQLFSMLNNNGIVVFESQTMPGDRKYFEFLEDFIKVGFKELKNGRIKDDKKSERNFVILKKAS